MNDALRYIGIAKKAGAIEIGETDSGAAIRSGKAKLLFLAADASGNAKNRAEGFVYGRRTPLIISPYTKGELSEISGKSGCSMAAFTDTGLALAFLQELAASDTKYAAVAEIMNAKCDKEKMRKRESASHAKNKRAGKNASTRRKQN